MAFGDHLIEELHIHSHSIHTAHDVRCQEGQPGHGYFYKEEHPPKSAVRYKHAAVDFIGGTLGGIACVYVGQPLDTVKVKIQTFPELYKNSVVCFTKTLQQEGLVRGLYAGTVPSLVAQVAENAVLFMMYGQCKHVVAALTGHVRSVDTLNAFENGLSGGCAAFFAGLVLCPTELIKCKLQALKQTSITTPQTNININNVGPWSLTRDVLRNEGVSGLFRGLTPTLAREMPGYCFYFGGYEATRSLLVSDTGNKDEIGAAGTMLAGGVGGLCFWTSVFPADVIKSRQQVGTSNESFLTIARDIIQREGLRGMYRGLGPCLLRSFPATAVLFLTYENTRKILTEYLEIP